MSLLNNFRIPSLMHSDRRDPRFDVPRERDFECLAFSDVLVDDNCDEFPIDIQVVYEEQFGDFVVESCHFKVDGSPVISLIDMLDSVMQIVTDRAHKTVFWNNIAPTEI